MRNKCYLLPTIFVCNANCTFCSTKTYNYVGKREFMQVDEQFFWNVEVLKSKSVPKIEITGGGEPFLNKALPVIIGTLQSNYPQVYIKMYTNGSILKKIPPIDEVNVSRIHWDPEVNNRFMRFRKVLPPLESVLSFFRDVGVVKLRLAIPMIKGAIDTREKLEHFMALTDSMVDEYVVRPLSPNTPNLADYYLNFDYSHPKLQVDRLFCSEHPALIWAADNRFYDGWTLTRQYLTLEQERRTYG